MITSGLVTETEFEIPGLSKEMNTAPILKMVPMNNHIIAMSAGNAGFQSDATQHLFTQLEESRKPSPNPFSSVPVRDTATMYVEFCKKERKVAVDVLLAPYGLTAESYIEKQKSMSDQFVEWVTAEVEKIRKNIGDSILFAGLDSTGAHIFCCDGDGFACCDAFAFAAIGSGGEHAESQFMLGGHTRLASAAETILLTYVAKKRSEVAPGVGKQTDMFVITPTPEGRFFLTAGQINRLDKVYRNMESAQKRAFVRAKQRVAQYIEGLQKKEAAASASVTPPNPVSAEEN
jgi:hypothetical protein